MDLPVFGEERGEALIEMVRRSVIGEDEAVVGPFGIRKPGAYLDELDD